MQKIVRNSLALRKTLAYGVRGIAEAVLLRRRCAVMKNSARARLPAPLVLAPEQRPILDAGDDNYMHRP